jgi:hypothetical protein
MNPLAYLDIMEKRKVPVHASNEMRGWMNPSANLDIMERSTCPRQK